jgi:hypothetical protein
MLSKNDSNKSKLTTYFVKDSDIYNASDGSKHFVICNYAKQMPISKKIIYDESYADHNKLIFEKSTAKFLLLEFKIKDDSYKIDLLTNEFDYYFVDNKFTREFFIYYVKTNLKPTLEINAETNCSIKIIDNNVNTYGFDFTTNQSIILLKDGYKINFDESSIRNNN